MALEEGAVVSQIPPRTSRAADDRDWDALVLKARESHPEAVGVPDVLESKVKALRQRQRAPYMTPQGRVKFTQRKTYMRDGERYGETYLMWVPTPKKRTR